MMNIWLIYGGMSSEKEIALESGLAVTRAMKEQGHRILTYELSSGLFTSAGDPPPIELDAIDNESWSEKLLRTGRLMKEHIDVVFLALHGGEGEGGIVQSLLTTLDLPFTGSGTTASALCMDKALAKRVMESVGVPTPPWQLVCPDDPFSVLADTALYEWPVVVKPVIGGSSVGISVVRQSSEWGPALAEAAAATEKSDIGEDGLKLLVEKYIEGREVTVAILEGKSLPVVEIIPSTGFYDYQRKYTAGASDYVAPAVLDEEIAARLRKHSVTLYKTIGCSEMARVDYRLTEEGEGFCLEINTIPGLTSTSLLPKAAAVTGLSFVGLLERVCQAAIKNKEEIS